MNAETETAIQSLSKTFADTAETLKRIANSLVNIALHLQAMRPSTVQTVRGPTRRHAPGWDPHEVNQSSPNTRARRRSPTRPAAP